MEYSIITSAAGRGKQQRKRGAAVESAPLFLFLKFFFISLAITRNVLYS